MRHTTQLLTLAIAALTLTACNDNHAIKETAYNYSFAMANYQIDEAAKYATNETIETTLDFARRIIEKIDTAYIISDTPANIEITEINKTSDTTAYAIYHKVTPIKDFSDTLALRKRDGYWQAHTPITHPQQQQTKMPSFSLPEE